jgi:hypothetical protein
MALAEPGDIAVLTFARIAPPLEPMCSITSIIIILIIEEGQSRAGLLIWAALVGIELRPC